MAREIKRVGVVGLGTMGAGIAQVGLQGGLEVVGREVTAELGERATERIGHFLTRAVEKGRLEQTARDAAMGRLSLTTDLAGLAACDLVVEAVFEDLDTAMTAGAGWPMGPCTLVDLVGIDVHVHASEALYAKLREPRMASPPRLVAMKNAGLLGRKTGRGFYTYDSE